MINICDECRLCWTNYLFSGWMATMWSLIFLCCCCCNETSQSKDSKKHSLELISIWKRNIDFELWQAFFSSMCINQLSAWQNKTNLFFPIKKLISFKIFIEYVQNVHIKETASAFHWENRNWKTKSFRSNFEFAVQQFVHHIRERHHVS